MSILNLMCEYVNILGDFIKDYGSFLVSLGTFIIALLALRAWKNQKKINILQDLYVSMISIDDHITKTLSFVLTNITDAILNHKQFDVSEYLLNQDNTDILKFYKYALLARVFYPELEKPTETINHLHEKTYNALMEVTNLLAKISKKEGNAEDTLDKVDAILLPFCEGNERDNFKKAYQIAESQILKIIKQELK